jgi:hypothetical protein
MLSYQIRIWERFHRAQPRGHLPEVIDRYLQRLLTADAIAAVFED